MKNLILYIVFNLCFAPQIIAQHYHNSIDEKIFKEAQNNIEKYRKTDFLIQLNGIDKKALKNIEIDVEQVSHDFLFGCIIFDLVNHGRLPENEELFKERFKQLFNFAVFPFYWASYEPVQGSTKQAEIMEVVNWCKQNGITTKGHPLAWTHTAGTPKWLAEYSIEDTKRLQMERIENITRSFKNQIEIWDVINEVIHTVNWNVAMKENNDGRNYRYVGMNYMSDKIGFIDSCFQRAYNGNPDAELIINEFDIVYNETSRKRFYNAVKELLEINSPISGIGIQAHEPNKGRIYYSPEQIWTTFETYSDFNLPLHITELIPVSNGDSIMGGYKTGIWTEQAQADFAEMIFTLSFGYPDMASINWWGFSDANIWQEGGGLVDEKLNPKPVYEKLDKLINEEWKTTAHNLKPTKKGEATFRGFKGDYKIIIKQEGEIIKEAKLNFRNYRNMNKPFPIHL